MSEEDDERTQKHIQQEIDEWYPRKYEMGPCEAEALRRLHGGDPEPKRKPRQKPGRGAAIIDFPSRQND